MFAAIQRLFLTQGSYRRRVRRDLLEARHALLDACAVAEYYAKRRAYLIQHVSRLEDEQRALDAEHTPTPFVRRTPPRPWWFRVKAPSRTPPVEPQ